MQDLSASDAVERFKDKLKSFAPLPEDHLNRWANILHLKQFGKGEVLLREGQICRNYYFVLNGCIRRFSLEDGKEVNLTFYLEDDFASDFESYRNEEPSPFYLVCLEETTVFCANKNESSQLLDPHFSYYEFLFRFFQSLYFDEINHSDSYKIKSPEERYQYLLEHKPQYFQRIPLTYLASYLGMSRETLTRIRKR